MIFSIRKQYLNYLSQPRKKQFEIPKYLELLVDKAIDLFNLSGISCVDMLQYMLEHDINNWVHYYAYTFIIPIAQGKSSECVKDLSDLYALVMTGYILDDFGFNRLNIEEIVKGEQLTHKKNPIALINKNINLDQLLAINNAMKYPLAYIQGPPGTGKTNTIINTIVKKNAICKAHNMEIIRVENSYARRYNHIKGILMDYFSRVH